MRGKPSRFANYLAQLLLVSLFRIHFLFTGTVKAVEMVEAVEAIRIICLRSICAKHAHTAQREAFDFACVATAAGTHFADVRSSNFDSFACCLLTPMRSTQPSVS